MSVLKFKTKEATYYTLLGKSYDSGFHQNVLLCFQMTAKKLKPK